MARQHTRRLLTGIATYVPGVERLSERATGGTNSAAYCYQIWLRHLILAGSVGLPTDPRSVAEVGPGDSLGTGITALLTGATTYVAVDLVEYANGESVAMVDAIGDLLAAGDPVSCAGYLGEDKVHPEDIIGRERIEAAFSHDRLSTVRAAASTPGTAQDGVLLTYSAGSGKTLELSGTVDMVFSQAVLEHVDDLEQIYASIASALAPGGFASHAIDFKSHSFARDWNGHWTFSDREWALVRGRRRYAINRQPLATHLRLIEASGLEVVNVLRTTSESNIAPSEVVPRFQPLSDEDLHTSSAVIQAVKR